MEENGWNYFVQTELAAYVKFLALMHTDIVKSDETEDPKIKVDFLPPSSLLVGNFRIDICKPLANWCQKYDNLVVYNLAVWGKPAAFVDESLFEFCCSYTKGTGRVVSHLTGVGDFHQELLLVLVHSCDKVVGQFSAPPNLKTWMMVHKPSKITIRDGKFTKEI